MLVPIYKYPGFPLLSQVHIEEDVITKDFENEDFNKAVDDSVKADKTSRKRIIDAAKILDRSGFPKNKISTKVRYECNKRGATDDYLNYVSRVLGQENELWIDKEYSHSRSTSEATENLENLNKPIKDDKFDDLRTSTTDTMPSIGKFKLTDEQFNKLSTAEKQQYREVRKKLWSQQKAVVNHGSTNDDELFESRGIYTMEEQNKKSTIIPPKQLWGKSDTYEYLHRVAERFDTVAKYLRDVAKQVYVFKLSKELDKESLDLLQSYHDERMIPLWETVIIGSEEIISILENVQDEKNRDSALGWMQKGCDKHWNFGNHGTGEVDYIQTGEYIFKLGKEDNVVIKIPVKRETTREQIGDKTTVRILDKGNQMFIKCPECKLEFNKPIIGDEERDLFAGDLFYKAADFLRGNKLSQAIETITDNVIFIQHRTPEQFFIEEWRRRGKVIKEPKIKLKLEKPTKIKTVDLNPNSRAEVGYNIWWGRSHRTADKSDWFSRQS